MSAVLVPGEVSESPESSDDERVMNSLRLEGAETAVEMDDQEAPVLADLNAAKVQGLAAQLSLTLGSVTEAVGKQWGQISRQVAATNIDSLNDENAG